MDEKPFKPPETLLPCPFCGAEPEFRIADDGGRYIGCPKCECATRLIYPLKTDVQEEVAEAWNGRARPAGAPEQEPGKVVRCSEMLALSAQWRDRALEIEERVKRCVERGSRGSFQMSYAKAQMLRDWADEIEAIGWADQANDQAQRRGEETP